MRSIVARRGRVWRSPAHDDVVAPRGAGLVAIAVAALVVAGSVTVARIDDGPRSVEATEQTAAAPAATASTAERVSLRTVAEQVGADVLWARGITGAGINVAVIDSGVAPVPALAANVVAVVDVSSEQRDPFRRFVDGDGHGTHMSGIIAGSDEATGFTGIAPDAGIVSVKVAGRGGEVTPADLVTGIDWVVDHADQLGIRVINLAFDSNDRSDYRTSELAAAVERAWASGIVVVTAAGNSGSSGSGLSLPASDPFVIAVGGLETVGGQLVAAEWASTGDAERSPDIAAPGAHLLSLRAPGSIADVDHPEGYVDRELFLGSGSSQAAAVVSGVVALVLQQYPEWSPDEVKGTLMATAQRVVGDAAVVGAGAVRADLAADSTPVALDQRHARAHVRRTGHQAPIAAFSPAGSAWAGSAWAGSAWAGSAWAGSAWAGSAWAGSAWAGSAWA